MWIQQDWCFHCASLSWFTLPQMQRRFKWYDTMCFESPFCWKIIEHPHSFITHLPACRPSVSCTRQGYTILSSLWAKLMTLACCQHVLMSVPTWKHVQTTAMQHVFHPKIKHMRGACVSKCNWARQAFFGKWEKNRSWRCRITTPYPAHLQWYTVRGARLTTDHIKHYRCHPASAHLL